MQISFSIIGKTKNRDTVILFFLAVIWFLIQGWLLSSGAKLSVDSNLYINDAKLIESGVLPQGRSLWYAGYSSFLALIFTCRGTFFTVVIIQVIVSGLAAFCIYNLVIEMTKQKSIALLSVLLYLSWFKIHEWNVFLYTESLFTSFSIISFTTLVLSKKIWHYLLVVLLLCFTFFIRPTGFPFVISICAYLFMKGFNKNSLKAMTVGLSVVMLIACILLLNKMLAHCQLIESYAQAEVIYPKITMHITAPFDLRLPDSRYQPLVKLLIFICDNPLFFLKLCIIKLLLFFGNIKPYFSPTHNAFIILTLFPLYFFALKGWKTFSANEISERYFIIVFIATQALTVTLTTENWDGRFLIPILPFVFMLSSAGIADSYKRMISKVEGE